MELWDDDHKRIYINESQHKSTQIQIWNMNQNTKTEYKQKYKSK